MAATSPYSLADIGPAFGGLGDILSQQVKDAEDERKKKLMQSSGAQTSSTANKLGLGALSLLGGGPNG